MDYHPRWMSTGTDYKYWVFLSIVSVCAFSLFLPALLTASGWKWGSLTYLIFAPVCHQIAERSFLFGGYPLAVCARCTGLYFGFWIGSLSVGVVPAFSRFVLIYPRALLLFAVPMLFDLMTENTHWSRFLTGLVAAAPVAILVWKAVEEITAFSTHRVRFGRLG